MFRRGEKLPNWKVQDSVGQAHELWNFRQKSHLVIIYDPEATPDMQKRWQEAVHMDRKQWEWLNASVLIAKQAPADVSPGVYLVDRYGAFMTYFPLTHWNFDDAEREFIYYEARHC